MISNSIHNKILSDLSTGKRLYWVLLDPDDFTPEAGATIARSSQDAGADAILIGGSLIFASVVNDFVKAVKAAVTIPVIMFPGDAAQVAPAADALLFLSLVSGRNPDFLIGEQVKGAPIIKMTGIEPISTAYILIDSGVVTSVEFMSNTKPIPREKPMIAAMHALAAEYIGMKLVYLEGGSGAKNSAPPEIIAAVKKTVSIPVIVGGGIRTPEDALEKLRAGADIIVTGNLLRSEDGQKVMKHIAEVIRSFKG